MSDNYHKINTIWKRDMENKGKKKGVIMPGEFSEEVVRNIRTWSLSEKIDGQCITVVVTEDDIKVFGKTEKTQFNKAHEPLLTYIAEKFTRDKVDGIFDWDKADKVCLYGEGFGVAIQKGGQYLKEGQKFILFDVVIDDIWMEEESVTKFAEVLDIPRVPLLGIVNDISFAEQVVQIRPLSLVSEQDPPCVIEGIVARAYPMVLHRFERTPVMFKLKVSDFERLVRANK